MKMPLNEEEVAFFSELQAQARKLNTSEFREFIRDGDYNIYKKKPAIDSVWVRLSFFPYSIVWLISLLLLPVNYVFTGSWGYGGNGFFIRFMRNWQTKIYGEY